MDLDGHAVGMDVRALGGATGFGDVLSVENGSNGRRRPSIRSRHVA